MTIKALFSVLIGVILLSSCTEYRKVLRSDDMQYKYDKAIEYYKVDKYAKAYPLFEELYIVYRGTNKGEKIAYYQAYCDFKMKDFLLAGHRFGQFYKSFPNSVYSEECQFMSAYCDYRLSPTFSLDQGDTYRAIRSFQLFAIDHPESERIDSCNTLLDELRFKVEKKDFEKARLYYRMENYKAATVSLNGFNELYPNSEYREESLFMAFDASFELAKNSIESKKVERIESAMKAYITFADRFPKSKRLREAESKYEDLEKMALKQSNT